MVVIGGGSGGTCLRPARGAPWRARRDRRTGPARRHLRQRGLRAEEADVSTRRTWRNALVDAPDYGFALDVSGHDWAALKARRDAYIERLRGIYAENLAQSGATLLRAGARDLTGRGPRRDRRHDACGAPCRHRDRGPAIGARGTGSGGGHHLGWFLRARGAAVRGRDRRQRLRCGGALGRLRGAGQPRHCRDPRRADAARFRRDALHAARRGHAGGRRCDRGRGAPGRARAGGAAGSRWRSKTAAGSVPSIASCGQSGASRMSRASASRKRASRWARAGRSPRTSGRTRMSPASTRSAT